MAYSFSNAKLISALANGFSVAMYRRGMSAVASQSQGVATSVVRGKNGMVKQVEERRVVNKEEGSSWVPDPVTGYYRPENRGAEIDVAELREEVLNHKIRHH